MSNTETRIKDGVEEHRHEERDYWHRVSRIHNSPTDRKGQGFVLTGCGVGCGHWEDEPNTGGFVNACAECQEQNGSCHVKEKVLERGGHIL